MMTLLLWYHMVLPIRFQSHRESFAYQHHLIIVDDLDEARDVVDAAVVVLVLLLLVRRVRKERMWLQYPTITTTWRTLSSKRRRGRYLYHIVSVSCC